jgi:hypothetical protein
MDLYERLRQSEQSRLQAWQVLQEIRQVLDILGDQLIPYEGEMKRFRAEGDFLVRALVNLISQCRSQIHQFEHDFEELEKLAGERELPQDVLQDDTSHGPSANDPRRQRAPIGRAPESVAGTTHLAGTQGPTQLARPG